MRGGSLSDCRMNVTSKHSCSMIQARGRADMPRTQPFACVIDAIVIAIAWLAIIALASLCCAVLVSCAGQPLSRSPRSIRSAAFAPVASRTRVVTSLDPHNDGVCDADCTVQEAWAQHGAGDLVTFAVQGVVMLPPGPDGLPRTLRIGCTAGGPCPQQTATWPAMLF